MKEQKQIEKKPNTFIRVMRRIGKYFKSLSPYVKNKLINCLIYFLGLFILLGVNYCAIFGAFVPTCFILDILLMIFLISPIFFFRGTLFDKIWIPIIMFFATLFICLNVNYYSVMGVIFCLRDVKLAIDNLGQAAAHSGDLNWTYIWIDVAIAVITVAAILVFNIKFNFKESKKTKKNPSRKVRCLFAGILMFSSLVVYEFSLGMWTISEKSKDVKSINYVNYNTNYHFSQLGMLSYYVKEARQYIYDKGVSDEEVDAYLNDLTPVYDNYTGLLDNPNVFVIMVETGDRLMANEYTTPNLWKLFKQNGVYGQHNYSYNRTNVSNTIGITGNYPVQTLNQNKTYNLPFSLPQILKAKDYNTRVYYDCASNIDGYNDMGFLKRLGFDNAYYHDELLPNRKPWTYIDCDYTPDTTVCKAILKNLKQFTDSSKQKFYVQWLTMYMHLESKVTDGNRINLTKTYDEFGPKLKDLEASGKWVNPCKDEDTRLRYEIWTLKTMDFDKALGKIMDFLYGPESTPELNNTILVAYGDHSWYEMCNGRKMNEVARGIYEDDNINVYGTLLGMYHPLLTQKIKDDKSKLFNNHDLNKMTTPATIVPSILDLMGIPYNKKIYQDKSMFDLNGREEYDSIDDEIFYSAWANYYMNEHYSSIDGARITHVYDDNNQRDSFVQKVKNKQYQNRVLDHIYLTNYFDRYDYNKYLPSITNFKFNNVHEYAMTKYY